MDENIIVDNRIDLEHQLRNIILEARRDPQYAQQSHIIRYEPGTLKATVTLETAQKPYVFTYEDTNENKRPAPVGVKTAFYNLQVEFNTDTFVFRDAFEFTGVRRELMQSNFKTGGSIYAGGLSPTLFRHQSTDTTATSQDLPEQKKSGPSS